MMVFFLKILLLSHQRLSLFIRRYIGKFKAELVISEEFKPRIKTLSLDLIDINSLVYLKKKEIPPHPSFEDICKLGRLKYKENERVEWILNDKLTGLKFVDKFGLRTPETYQRHIPFNEVRFDKQLLIKPVSGASARGVFAIFNENTIWDVSEQQAIGSLNKLHAHVRQLLLENIICDEWIVEELISNAEGEIARDLKFYAFYGKIVQVVEVKRYPNTKFCYWSRDRQFMEDSPNSDKFFQGSGFTEDQVQQVEKLSLALPVPFMRIDFLNTGKELVFCEFTPSPGSISNYSESQDRILGHEYMKAEYRLFKDLMNGKNFSLARQFMQND